MRKVAVFSLLSCMLFLLLQSHTPHFLQGVRLRIEDSLYAFQFITKSYHVPDQRLVLVAVDEKSINKLGRWPWNRELMAKLVEMLSPADLVVFDVVFSEPSEGDKSLAKAIADAGNVVLGFFLRKDATQSTTTEQTDTLRNSELMRVKKIHEKIGIKEFPYAEVNIKELAESALMQAPFNSEPDADGLYRRYPIAYLFAGSLYPSMALQAYRLYKNQDIELVVSKNGVESVRVGGSPIPVSNRRYILLNFPKTDLINPLSAVDVLEGKADLKGKIVFFGATEIGIYDIRPTPTDPYMPGVVVHYTALSNLLKGDLIKDMSTSTYVSIPILSFLPLVLTRFKRFKIRATLYFLTLLTFLSLSFFAFSYMRLFLPFFFPLLSLTFSYVSLEVYFYYLSERRVKELRRAFSSYLSPQLLEIVLKNPDMLKLGGEKRELSVLFSDVRGFTALSERLEPETLVSILNEYLEPMTHIVLENGGMLDKYIGDAIMAVFNAPVDLPDHADKACISALRMLEKLKEVNHKLKQSYGIELSIGVGINTGYAVVGNMGSKIRFDYTAIGDTVNLASRLEGLNKLYGTSIIVSQYTVERLRGSYLLRPLDKVAVKGKKKPVMIYELMEDSALNQSIAELYKKALDLYFNGEFEEAMLRFEELIIRYNDGASKTMLERCRVLALEKPEVWEGVYVAKEK